MTFRVEHQLLAFVRAQHWSGRTGHEGARLLDMTRAALVVLVAQGRIHASDGVAAAWSQHLPRGQAR